MGFQWFNTWPYSYSYLPSMDAHIDPVNNTWFTGLNQEVYNLEYFLGLNPQGSYKNVAQRLDDIETGAGKFYSTVVVSTDGDNADYDNIQDAIDAVEALGGGRVLVREGTYTIASSLTINGSDNIILQGMGHKTVIISSAALTSLLKVCDVSNQHKNIIIRDICFDGNSQQSASTGLLWFSYAERSAVTNCFFTQSNGRAIYFDNADNCLCYGNFITDILSRGIGIEDNTSYTIISGNTLYNAGTNLAGIHVRGTYNIVSNNSIEDSFNSIHFEGAYCSATGNTIYGSGGDGIIVQSEHCTVSNNVINNATVDGIYITESLCTVSGNTTDGCNVGIYNSANYNTISSNTIYNSTSYSIKLDNQAIVSNNIIRDSGNNSIWLSSVNTSHSIISNNTIYSSAVAGINISAGNYITIIGNSIYSSAENGISVDGDYINISGNSIYSSAENGIFITGSDFSTITGNILVSNGTSVGTWAGIMLQSTGGDHCSYIQMSGNTLDENGNDYGIREADANQDYNNVVGNIAQNAGTANISLQGANSVKANNIE